MIGTSVKRERGPPSVKGSQSDRDDFPGLAEASRKQTKNLLPTTLGNPEHAFYFDGYSHRQSRCANSGADVSASIPEDCKSEIGRTIHDLGVLFEVGSRKNESSKPDDLPHPIECPLNLLG